MKNYTYILYFAIAAILINCTPTPTPVTDPVPAADKAASTTSTAFPSSVTTTQLKAAIDPINTKLSGLTTINKSLSDTITSQAKKIATIQATSKLLQDTLRMTRDSIKTMTKLVKEYDGAIFTYTPAGVLTVPDILIMKAALIKAGILKP